MSTARLLVLGSILRKGINHGYGVYSDVTSWRVETWTSVKPGSIYHALEKLESQGMIQAVDSDNRVKYGPSRTEYKVTPQGEAEFESLMASALTSNDFQLFGVGLAFMELLPRQDVLNLLEERLQSLTTTIEGLKTLPTEEIPSAPSKHPELVGLWISYIENQRSNTQRVIEALQSGKYVFKNEKGEERTHGEGPHA